MAITGCTLTGTISDTPDRPSTMEKTYLRSFDAKGESDALQSLRGAAVNEGPYQDCMVILQAVASAYAALWTTATQQQLSPRNVLQLLRDSLLLMLNTSAQSVVRTNSP